MALLWLHHPTLYFRSTPLQLAYFDVWTVSEVAAFVEVYPSAAGLFWCVDGERSCSLCWISSSLPSADGVSTNTTGGLKPWGAKLKEMIENYTLFLTELYRNPSWILVLLTAGIPSNNSNNILTENVVEGRSIASFRGHEKSSASISVSLGWWNWWGTEWTCDVTKGVWQLGQPSYLSRAGLELVYDSHRYRLSMHCYVHNRLRYNSSRDAHQTCGR